MAYFPESEMMMVTCYYAVQNLLDQITENEMHEACSKHGGDKVVGKPEGKRALQRCRHTSEDDIKWILEKQGSRACTGFICVRTGTSGRLL
jgi:hypothetical protein